MTPLFVGLWGTIHLLFVSTLFHGFSFCLLIYIFRVFRNAIQESEHEHSPDTPRPKQSLKKLLSNNYIKLFLGVSLISYFSFYIVDYIFYDVLSTSAQYTGADQLASFLGLFFGFYGLVNLFINLFISGPALNRYGVRNSLLALPIAIAITLAGAILGSAFGAASLFFWLIMGTKLLDEVARTGFEGPLYRLLYQALQSSLRIRIQTLRESIIEPIALGIAGAVLLVFGSALDFSAITIAWMLILLFLVWIRISILLGKEYTESLKDALKNKSLDANQLKTLDAATRKVFEEKLNSKNPLETLYCFETLFKADVPNLENICIKLIDHGDVNVRQTALEIIEKKHFDHHNEAVRHRYDIEPDVRTKALCLRTLGAIAADSYLDFLKPFLHSDDPWVEECTIIGLLQNGGIDSIMAAGNQLNKMLDSKSPKGRILAARILEHSEISSFYRPLIALLHDEDLLVRKEALKAAGHLGNWKLIPAITSNLETPELTQLTVNALRAFGERGIEPIKTEYKKTANGKIKLQLLKSLVQIDSEKSTDFLIECLDSSIASVIDTTLDGLIQRDHEPNEATRNKLLDLLNKCFSRVHWLILLRQQGQDESDEIQEALDSEFKRLQNRILDFLAVLYDSKALTQVADSLRSGQPTQHAYAIEVLDNMLPDNIKDPIIAIMEECRPSVLIKKLSSFKEYSPITSSVYHSLLVEPPQSLFLWTGLLAIYESGKHNNKKAKPVLAARLDHTNPAIRETALWALHIIDRDWTKSYIKKLLNDTDHNVASLALKLSKE